MKETKKEIITAATDFSKAGDFAIENAANLASVMHAKLTVFHVLDAASKSTLNKNNKDSSYLAQKLAETAESIQDAKGIETEYKIVEGNIFSTIPHYTTESNSNYLFLGTLGKHGKQMLVGSSLLKIIKKSSVPVFVIQKPSGGNKFKNIVYPLNTDIGSKQKINWAIDLNKYAGSAIHIFVENPKFKSYKGKLSADLHQVQKILDQQGAFYTITHATKKGSFVRQIISFSKDIKADAIMTTTNPDKISWAFFKSAEEKIIYNKELIPVICVKTKDYKRIIGGM